MRLDLQQAFIEAGDGFPVPHPGDPAIKGEVVVLLFNQRFDLLPDELPKPAVGVARERTGKCKQVQGLSEGVDLPCRHLMLGRMKQVVDERHECRLPAEKTAA